MSIFQKGNFLLPKEADWQKWAVIACDQFTSQKEYWQAVAEQVGQAPSTLHLMLPEIYLESDCTEKIVSIHATMLQYLEDHLLREYANAFVYVERTLGNGRVRQGLVGIVDLEQYDYLPGSKAAVRATEKTVLERIPPRKKIRQRAALELSHVLLLADDPQNFILGMAKSFKADCPLLYDFNLMQGGGHIRGWLVQGAAALKVQAQIEAYEKNKSGRLVYAVGDGNHSLATAKSCYEEEKKSGAKPVNSRYAMVELENIRDGSLEFAPIHRLLKGVDQSDLLGYLRQYEAEGGYPIPWQAWDCSGKLHLNRALGALPLGILQRGLDEYLAKHQGIIDYIHGDKALDELSKAEDCLGFFLPPLGKNDFFRSVEKDGVLPRKTFSMGQAEDKRYYLETRVIKDF